MHREREPSYEPENEQRPGIWVGSLADYNNGILFGTWLDPARALDDVQADIRTMLDGSPTAAASGLPSEEYAIFDNDYFGPLRIGEYEDLDYVCRVARGIVEHGQSYAAWASIADRESLEDYEEHFVAHVSSVDEYVEDMVADLGYDELLDRATPSSLRPYVSIDIAALARDMQLGGDITPVSDGQGGYWLFHNH